MFFDSWSGLLRVLVVGVLAYGLLIAMLRVSGKRTLSKLNAFDLIVTVALGSTLSTILISKDVALTEGMLALALLISLQWGVAWLSVRSTRWGALIKSEPQLLAVHGRLLEGAMRRERITTDEVYAAIRAQGGGTLQEITAVVLETDGTLTVVKSQADELVTLRQVRGFGAEKV